MNLKIECFEFVGLNDEWQFAIAKVGDRWLGVALEGKATRAAREAFASEGLPVDRGYMHVFARVSDGCNLGMADRTKAMLLTGALAEDPEQGFGGIDEWLVPEDLRGEPDKLRCKKCGEVGCDGRDCEEDYGIDYPFEEEGEIE